VHADPEFADGAVCPLRGSEVVVSLCGVGGAVVDVALAAAAVSGAVAGKVSVVAL
jgi:hypothetical protein